MNRYLVTTSLFITLALSSPVVVSAQEADTTLGWTNGIVGTLSMTQAAFDNWQQGGDNSLAWQMLLNAGSTYLNPLWKWQNTGRFNLGFNKIGDQGTRKSIDEIKLESALIRLMSKYLNPYVAFQFRTQFAAGFQYDADQNSTKVSKFMDPGYFTESAGVGYASQQDPRINFESRVGAALKQTVTNDFPAYSDDPETAQIEKVRHDIGVSWVSKVGAKPHQNIALASQLDVFHNFKGVARTDVFWENLITMTVTKYINVTFNFDVLYDKNVSDRRQIRQQLAVGFTYTFL